MIFSFLTKDGVKILEQKDKHYSVESYGLFLLRMTTGSMEDQYPILDAHIPINNSPIAIFAF